MSGIVCACGGDGIMVKPYAFISEDDAQQGHTGWMEADCPYCHGSGSIAYEDFPLVEVGDRVNITWRPASAATVAKMAAR